MKHMGIDDRNRLEFLAACGRSANQIAEDRGRSPSAIREEFIRHRIASDRGYGCSNRVCAHFDDCQQRTMTAARDALRKNTPGCFESCPNFREAACHRLTKFPYVCNGCERERSCPLHKKFYIASAAQAAYESLRSLSRTGVRPDDETVRKMDEVLSPSVRKGQSVTAIVRANAETFGGFAPSTVYGWLEDGLFSARGSDLPYAGRRRKRHKRPETKTNAACRIGRTFLEMHEWLKLNPGVVPCGLDTVIGSVSGKVLFTMIFPESGLALGFLRDAKTSQTCTRIFNMPWDLAGPKLSRRLFAVVLPDNGPEFSDPVMIEMYRPDPAHNPTKLVPRGVKAFFCDPHCPSQKPHVERVHVELRRIFEKGAPFDSLRQEHVNLAMSHVNSPARDSLGGKCAYDAFVEEFGAEGRTLLDALGTRRIPASEVTLHPFLLGERFQRIADRAVLRRNGIGKPGTDGLRK